MGTHPYHIKHTALITALLATTFATSALAQSTTVEVGGYIKTDFIYDFDEALGDAFNVDGITITGVGDNARFRAHARQTRLFFKASTETERGPLKTHVEFDFFGGGGNEVFSNSYSPRLRHAYGTWNGWTVGQTWSNFMPIESYPSTVDFNGPAGIAFIRQAQIRYSFPVSGNVTISASLENSEFSGRDAFGTISESTGTGIQAGLDQYPDFTLAAAWKGEKAFVKLATVVRKFNSPTSNDTATGWGVNLSGNAALWEGDTDNVSTAHASLFYKPTQRMTVGAEVIYGRREIVSGANDNATRLQTSVRFSF